MFGALGAFDGGAGQDNKDGENTPLLAILAPPRESWLDRRGAAVGEGDLGSSGMRGAKSMRSSLVGLDNLLSRIDISRTGGPSSRRGERATVGLGCVTGLGRVP